MGLQRYGQLGYGSIGGYQPQPVVASGLTNIIGIAAGDDHSLAVDSNGVVWAWGLNGSGQLGDGSLTNQDVPVQTTGISNAVAVAGGTAFSVSLNSDGTQSAWGDNQYGELANGTTTFSNVPVTSSICMLGTFPGPGKTPLDTRISVSQAHILVAENDGAVWGWGQNQYGELGNGTTVNSNTPVQALGLTSMTAVAAGYYHSIALRSDGTVWTWGYNGNDQLGNGGSANTLSPGQVPNFTGAVAVAAGDDFSAVLKSDGTVWAFGGNTYGDLGDGGGGASSVPVQVIGANPAVAIAAGEYHTLALRNDGTVWAWGANSSGQLGNGTYNSASSAVQVVELSGVIAIAAGQLHSLALKSDGTVWTWGYNGYGQLGLGDSGGYATLPVRASGLANIIGIAAGDDHSLAVDSNGVVWAWGYNGDGELGNASQTNSPIPIQVYSSSGFSTLQAVAGGTAFSVALQSDGAVWAWGLNSVGQFGALNPGSSNVPVATTQTGITFFSDVLPTDFDYAAVQLMDEHAITGGCSAVPEEYCPNDNITRGQMAVFIVRSIEGGDNFTFNPVPYFTDVPATDPYFPWIQEMYQLGITGGCSATMYCPDDDATRGQMAVFIIRARYGSTTVFNYPTTPYFTDVPANYVFFSWIQKMAELGITAGCGPSLYCPDNPVTRGQMAIFIIRGGFNALLPAGTPTISALAPSVATIGQTVTITLQGVNTNFVQDTTQLTGPGLTVNSITVINPTRLTVNLSVSSTAVAGPVSIVVTTGAQEVTLPNFLMLQSLVAGPRNPAIVMPRPLV